MTDNSAPRRRGRPRTVELQPGKKVKVELRLDPEAAELLLAKAAAERRTLASVIDRLLLGEDHMDSGDLGPSGPPSALGLH
jgi:hypothetical protein